MRGKEPSIIDTIAGIGTAIAAAAVIEAVILVPLLLVLVIVQQGAGLMFAGVLLAAGAIVLALRWIYRREHHGPWPWR